MRPLRVGVNALYLIPGGVGGTEIYLRRLLAALARIDPVNRYTVFTNAETGAGLVPDQSNFEHAPQGVRAVFRPARILWEQSALPLAALRRRVDVLFNPGFTAPIVCGCPQVTVFHDLQHKRHPEYFRWFDLPFWRALLFASAHLSTTLLADSAATAADLHAFYRLPERKVRTVPLGVDRVFFEIGARRAPADPPFLLAVSTLHPHKNLEGLLAAFERFRRERPRFRLVVAGLRGFEAERLEQARHGMKLAGAVEFTGWIPREQLYELYRRAFAFVYPSKFEGFGLPVLEALAAGVPTACSDIPPLREIAGDAAVRFDPEDGAALLEAMVRVTEDARLREEFGAAGPRRAASYTWEATARATLQALLETAARAFGQHPTP